LSLCIYFVLCWFPACIASLSCSFWFNILLTFDQKKKMNAATYDSPDNDTYGSHISTNLSTYTSTTISWFILCRSTISWFVSATSTMIVSFVVSFLLYFDLFVLMQV
jgi:putative flippase GtrA